MSDLWVPGAERLKPSSDGGTITSTAPPRVVWHTTEAPSGNPKMFGRMHEVLTDKSAEPHILIDPLTDRMGQYFPLNRSGRALKNDTDGTRNNRVGRVCIQIEVIAYAADPFTDGWKPGPNWNALMRSIRSWGIPDVLPAGAPPKYPGPSNRPRETWRTKAGHYSHANIPGNNHGDPGAIAMGKIFALGKSVSPPKEEDPMAGLTKQDLTEAFLAALKQNNAADYAGEQKLVVADNAFDSQAAAWHAVANALAAKRIEEAAVKGPLTAGVLKEIHQEVWNFLRPLWAS